VDSVLEYYERYEHKAEDFTGISIVAPYEVLIGVLNHLVKCTSFNMKNIHLEDGECADYWSEWILTVDFERQIWVQEAKYGSGYIFTEDDVVFVHNDVNSAFVKKNEKENLIAFEIGTQDNESVSHVANHDTDDYHLTVKSNSDAIEALKIVKDLESRINRMNIVLAEMDRFYRLFQW